MKYLASITLALFTLLTVSSAVLADPSNEEKAGGYLFNKYGGNKNVVAYYPDGTHTILGQQDIIHTGEDLVMRAGKSNNFQQWFVGTSDEEGLHGHHTVWRVKKTENCPKKWTYVANPNNPPDGDTWGYYFPEDTDYCVKTNIFKVKI